MPSHKIVDAPTLDAVWEALRNDHSINVRIHKHGPDAHRAINVRSIRRSNGQFIVEGEDLPNHTFCMVYNASEQVEANYELKYQPSKLKPRR